MFNFIFATIATIAALAMAVSLLALALGIISPTLGAIAVTGTAAITIFSASFIEE